jgi:hypothetical protein
MPTISLPVGQRRHHTTLTNSLSRSAPHHATRCPSSGVHRPRPSGRSISRTPRASDHQNTLPWLRCPPSSTLWPRHLEDTPAHQSELSLAPVSTRHPRPGCCADSRTQVAIASNHRRPYFQPCHGTKLSKSNVAVVSYFFCLNDSLFFSS